MTPARAPRRRLARTVVVSTAALAVLGGLAACGSKDAPTALPSISVTPSVAETTPEPTSPFTGLALDGDGGSVLAVKIDNTASALPHIGLSSADIVYVEQVEGGLTRIAAIYASKKPDQIAPIRSARETDAELLQTYGKIPVAFSGSVASVHALIAAAGLQDVSEDKGELGYTRLTTRYAPYNLAGDPKVLVKRGTKTVHPRDVGLTFGDAPDGGKAAKSVTANFPSARIGFTYDADTNRWVYTLNGQKDQVVGAKAQSASTVIVQYVSIGSANRGDKVGNTVPFTHSVGSGKALVARDGKVYNVRWSRTAKNGPTHYTYKGEDFPMGAGQQWIVLANNTSKATVVYDRSKKATAAATTAP